MNAGDKHRWLVIAAAASFGLMVLDKLVITPGFDAMAEQSERLTALRASVTEGNRLLAREASLRERWADMRRRALPTEAPVAEDAVFKAVARWTGVSHVTLMGLVPQWRNNKDGARVMECRASVQGDLRSVARFLYELETDPLALRLEQCDLVSRDARGTQLTLNARFSGLWLAGMSEDEQ